jgi:hypothetical protein
LVRFAFLDGADWRSAILGVIALSLTLLAGYGNGLLAQLSVPVARIHGGDLGF